MKNGAVPMLLRIYFMRERGWPMTSGSRRGSLPAIDERLAAIGKRLADARAKIKADMARPMDDVQALEE